MFLSNVLKANALFSAICGFLCLSLSGPIAAMLGEVSPMLLIVLGIGLLIFAADVVWISRQLPEGKARAKVIFWADVSWVVLTPVFIVIFMDRLSTMGLMVLGDIALIVAVFAWLEWRGLKKLDSQSSPVMA